MVDSRSSLQHEIGKRDAFASLEQETHLNLLRTTGELSSVFDQLFKQHGLSRGQYNILRILRGQQQPTPVNVIGEQMITRLPDLTRLVDRLHAASLVERARGEKDRRTVLVELTEAGKKLLAKLDEPVMQLHRQSFSHLTADELKHLNRLLFKARQNKTEATSSTKSRGKRAK